MAVGLVYSKARAFNTRPENRKANKFALRPSINTPAYAQIFAAQVVLETAVHTKSRYLKILIFIS